METFMCGTCNTVGVVALINNEWTVSPCDCVAKEN